MKATADALQLLQQGQLELEGQLTWSSNYAFLMQLSDGDQEALAVYKPQRGERPLWDFAQGSLCLREYAAYLISDALGWHIVPPTILRAGPYGLGSLQLFINHDPECHYFTIQGNAEFAPQLQKIALFDLLTNNADRKAGHILIEEDEDAPPADVPSGERLWGIDHGICFHHTYKLRTVVWEFAGQPIPPDLLDDIDRLQTQLASNTAAFRSQLEKLLSAEEMIALQKRLQRIQTEAVFWQPGPGRHYPWPPV